MAVEVCWECDIAGCHHIRERQAAEAAAANDLRHLKDEVMTLELHGGLWVPAEDYAEAQAHIKRLEAALDECEHATATIVRLEAENAGLKAAILALSKAGAALSPREGEGT